MSALDSKGIFTGVDRFAQEMVERVREERTRTINSIGSIDQLRPFNLFMRPDLSFVKSKESLLCDNPGPGFSLAILRVTQPMVVSLRESPILDFTESVLEIAKPNHFEIRNVVKNWILSGGCPEVVNKMTLIELRLFHQIFGEAARMLHGDKFGHLIKDRIKQELWTA